MKRRRQPVGLPKITAEQARQALLILVADGRIAAREVFRALARRENLVRELRQRLATLGAEGSAAVARATKRSLSPGTRRAIRRGAGQAITAAQRAARQAQGRYLGAIRQLSKASKAKVREIRKSSGVKAAIVAAKKLAAKA
ncbi:MAG TPA: hypothetical protein VMR54_18075 [Thermoanaerobaculia bacterium]|nr:hypothetical protein [Thermoanaerobaculia bacterium]